MIMQTASVIVQSLIQIIVLVVLAPFLQGVIKKIKARWQCRSGPGIMQSYYDLWKLLRKDEVISEHTSWLFPWYPWITIGGILAVGLLVPVISSTLPLGFAGDLLLVVGLLALVRFVTALAGIEAGSAFGGMGSSREMALAVVIEPAMVLSLLVLAIETKTTNLGQMVDSFAQMGFGVVLPGNIMVFLALLVVVIAETGRIPVDNPDTHLELTMIHEGMLLEYSGRSLGLMFLAAQIKQLVMVTVIMNLFFPWGLAADWQAGSLLGGLVLLLLKVVCFGALLATIETAFNKIRLFRVPELLGASFVLSLLGLMSMLVFPH
ncbi:MAG TPA: NADH-quinone oxidoreductase subunit H [Bacillota bacterium]|nr:NADH-quinone oxidoreductase subunit H [Bacillota bacterium]